MKALTKADVNLFYKGINDDEMIKYSLSLFSKINTKEEIENWFLALIRNRRDITLGIISVSTNELISYAGICNISDINRSLEYYISVGEK